MNILFICELCEFCRALGLGNARGRLYIRHPDVFKYIGDPDDRSWLCEQNLLPAVGGKAYMLILEDIEDLSKTDEYRMSPGLMMHECVGFTVPEWMIVKMKEQMNALRTDGPKSSTFLPSTANDTAETKPNILPFTSGVLKEESLVSPADTEEMDFLSTADNDDTQPSSVISPFNLAGGFEEVTVSPSPSDLDTADTDYPHFL
ncbi:deoxynucleotidyltransferase terminal-interacting protein 1 [Elysia marginata]|uniref:Deoxynucleotidyltransferase terminal-interacting protein 1 n=1 Tax=Elysia marginata TaxID=1093978 RepID=A0AAV4F5G2_9GAST|nr:deoxynucleotidyltransferase terminal-interacting protein 1 [Elysia marginata]